MPNWSRATRSTPSWPPPSSSPAWTRRSRSRGGPPSAAFRGHVGDELLERIGSGAGGEERRELLLNLAERLDVPVRDRRGQPLVSRHYEPDILPGLRRRFGGQLVVVGRELAEIPAVAPLHRGRVAGGARRNPDVLADVLDVGAEVTGELSGVR